MSVQVIWASDHIVFPVGRHKHSYYQLIFCKKGDGYIEISGQQHDAVNDTIFFIQPMQEHCIENIQGSHLMEVKFTVSDVKLASDLSALPTAFTPKDRSSFFRSLADVIKEARMQTVYCNSAANAGLLLMLIRLLRPYVPQVEEPLNRMGMDVPLSTIVGKHNQTDVSIATLLHWVENHFAENITLESLCQMSNMTKSALVDNFNRMNGMSPIQYVNWVRLAHAKNLLTNSNKTVTEIALETGFSSVHYFSRYFKSKENMTPVAYREITRNAQGSQREWE